MKVAGWIAIGVAALLLLAAASTWYNNKISIDESNVANAEADFSSGWSMACGAEAVVGAAFLVSGIALASRKD